MSPLKYHAEMDDDVRRLARDMLRLMCRDESYKKEDSSADAVIEQVWNVLVGFPPAGED